MIVTLGTTNLSAKKNSHGIVDVGQRHPLVAQLISDGGTLPKSSIGSEHFISPCVERCIRGDRSLDIVEIGFKKELLLRSFAQSKNVSPEIIEMADVVWTFKQSVYQVGPLGFLWRIEKSNCLVEGRNASTKFEVDPTNELVIFQSWTFFFTVLCPVSYKQRVDGDGGLVNFFATRSVERRDIHNRARVRLDDRFRQANGRRYFGFWLTIRFFSFSPKT